MSMENTARVKTEPVEVEHTTVQGLQVTTCDVDIKTESDSTSLLVPPIIKKEAFNPIRNENEAKIIEDVHTFEGDSTLNVRTLKNSTRVGQLKKNVKVICGICNYHFSNQWTLKQHMLTHSKDKQMVYKKETAFSCSVCGQGYSGYVGLERHMIEHSGEVYTCSVCDKAFPTRKRFNQHVDLVHSVIKRFRCFYCPKAFSVKTFLISHIRTHTGEKPFVCPKCDKGFSQEGALKRHVEVVCGKRTPRNRKAPRGLVVVSSGSL